MEIRNARFIRGIVGSNGILKSKRKQIAFIGRSNVGKSTLINNLIGNQGLVKISKQPGKTKEINFFSATLTYSNTQRQENPTGKRNKEIYLVDLPGYGYAKISQAQREKMRKMILWYFISGEPNLKKVILIVDAKAGLKEFDLEMIDVLKEYAPKLDYRFIIVANKIDKLNQKQAHKNLQKIKEKIGGEIKIIPMSAKTGRGREMLLEWISEKVDFV